MKYDFIFKAMRGQNYGIRKQISGCQKTAQGFRGIVLPLLAVLRVITTCFLKACRTQLKKIDVIYVDFV
jgi:hypothetical protein